MKRYAIVGLGHRATLYLDALTGPHAQDGTLVGLCDRTIGRAEAAARVAQSRGFDVPVFHADGFDTMIAAQRPDRIIVTVPDNLHASYIERALDLGCDVITEKPLTVNAESCGRILAACRRTGRAVVVGFNMRYSPMRTLVKQALMSGIIGHVQSATFEWLLDTHHGADYFRRWHRTKANSGGLFVHKATHHFDVLNWWLADIPRRVKALGRRVFYRPEIGDALGLTDRGPRCTGCPAFDRCGFRLDMAASDHLTALYADHEHADGYHRDLCVFSLDIDIEDQMQALIEYEGGIVVNYTLTAYNPCEGHRVVFNGTRGRLELLTTERSHVQPDGRLLQPPVPETNSIRIQPHFGRTYELALPPAIGAHGGGDTVMLRRLFGPPTNDEYGHTADDRAGAWSALVGIAANASLLSGEAVALRDLLADVEAPDRIAEPFGPAAIWQRFEPKRYPFLQGATVL